MKIFEIVNRNIRTTLNFSYFKKPEEEKHGPIITISREKSAGGTSIAEILAKKLGRKWEFYNKDIIEKIASESKVSIDKIEEIDEKNSSYLDSIIESLIGKDYYSLDSYYRSLIKVLTEIGSKGHVIIVGRGANFLFKDALKVRIIADDEFRIDWEIQNYHLSRREAVNKLKKVDKERSLFVYNLYNKEISDPKYYDLVIKISPNLTIEKAVDIIALVARKRFKL